MKKFWILVLIPFFLATSAASAADATPPAAGAPTSWGLLQVWDLAVRNNPDLRSKRAAIEQQDLAAAAARAEYSVDVTISGRAATEDTNQDDDGGGANRSDNSLDNRYYGELAAALPFFDKAPEAFEARQAALDAGLAREDYANTIRSLELDAMQAYLDVVVAQRVLEIKKQASAVAEERSRAAAEGYRLGRLAQKDELSERAYALEKHIASTRAANDLADKKRVVEDLVGGSLPPNWSPEPESVSATVKDEAALRALPRSDWLFRDNALTALRSQLEIRKQGWWFEPRFSVRGYGFSGDTDDGEESGYGGAVGVQIPFPNIALTRRNKRLAEAELSDVERELENEQRWYDQEIKRALASVVSLRSVVDSLVTGVGVKQSEFEIALRDVALGRLTRPQLQGVQDGLIEWRSDLENAKADQLTSRARLQYLLTGHVFGSTGEIESEMVHELRKDRTLRRMIKTEPTLSNIPGLADAKP